MPDTTLESQFYTHMHAAGQADPVMNQRVLAFYVPYFASCREVLDVGCGEGQMLELLAARGIAAHGLDSDAGMVTRCQQRGLAVTHADIFDYLPTQTGVFDGIFSSNVIEHLSAQQAIEFLRLACDALRPGGVLVIATPNPESHIVHLHEFWRDATHVRLYSRHLLDFLLNHAGLRNIATGENPYTVWGQPAMGGGSGTVAASGGRSGGTIWNPWLPVAGNTGWRRPVYWLRRRLAQTLARNVMFEEFASIETRLEQLNEMRTPYVAAREVFAAGVKPLAAGTVPALSGWVVDAKLGPMSAPPRGDATQTGTDTVAVHPVAERGRPRVAWLMPHLPYPPDTGGKIRSYHLLRTVAERCDVDLYAVQHSDASNSPEIAALRAFCRQVTLVPVEKPWRTRDRWRRVLAALPRSVDYFSTPVSLARVREWLLGGQYDLLIADEICMTPYAELTPDLPRIVIRHKVDHLHYAEMADARPWGPDKILDRLEARKLRRYEHELMPRYRAFLACSAQDAAIIQCDAPHARSLVVPNGVDLATYVPLFNPKPKPPQLLYVGSMNYYPNVDALLFYFETMHQRIVAQAPNLRVQIVGHKPPPQISRLAQLPGVEVTGSVPDVRPYYERATAFFVPLRLGGGTRLKILEAMAMGVPVVSTSIGAEGLELHPGQDILIADEPDTFVRETLRLLTDKDVYARITEGGRRLAARYDWRALSLPFADLVVDMAQYSPHERP